MTGRSKNSSQAGFTLLEMLVAMAIFATALLVFERSMAGVWRGVTGANLRTAAVTLALAKLEEASAATPFQAGQESEGRSGHFDWRVQISEALGKPEFATPTPQELLPLWVDVDVTWRDGINLRPFAVHYRLLKLGRRPS